MVIPTRYPGSDRFREQSAATMTERHLQADVVALGTALGWRHFHVYDSRRSNPGWPDLAMWRGPRFLVAELKTQKGRVRPEQRTVLDELAQAAVESYLWRPMDLLDGTVERILRGPS